MNPYLLALIVVVNLAIWTFFDASRLRDEHHVGIGPKGLPPHSWASLVLLLAPLAFPYYLNARSDANRTPRRDGPPPEFTARQLNVWGYLGGVVFFGLAVFLIFTGRVIFGALAGVAMVAGLFGGRKSQQVKSGGKSFDLGRAAWDMSGFKPVQEEDFDDDLDAVALPLGPSPSRSADAAVDVFSPLDESNRSGPQQPAGSSVPASEPPASWSPPQLSEPVSGVFDPDLVADAAPPVAMAVSDDDVWDPVRADEEARKFAERQAGAGAPPDAGRGAPPAVPPPRQRPDRHPDGDELAPFQLGSEEDLAPGATATRDPEADDEDLSHLLPLPPMVTGGRRPPGRSTTDRPADGRAAGLAPAKAPRRPQAAPAGPAARPPAQGPDTPAMGSGSGASSPYSYAGASKSAGAPSALLWFAGISAIVALAWGYSRLGGPPDTGELPADPVVAEQPSVDPAVAGETPPEVADAARAAEEAMRLRMNEWISTYDGVMRPIAELVEQIDFGELGTGACLELQRKAKNADRSLKQAPDEEVELLLRPAFESFVAAGKACTVSRKQVWSVHLLQAKDHTHETQILLDERYRYVGPYELEQEEALGHSRSTESISGKYLAGQLYEDE